MDRRDPLIAGPPKRVMVAHSTAWTYILAGTKKLTAWRGILKSLE